MTVSIRNRRRHLTIELPVPEDDGRAEDGKDASDGAWTRAGGWAGGASRPYHERFPSLLVVTSRLNFQKERQQETLLTANGFRLTENLPEREPVSRPRPLDVVPSTSSTPR